MSKSVFIYSLAYFFLICLYIFNIFKDAIHKRSWEISSRVSSLVLVDLGDVLRLESEKDISHVVGNCECCLVHLRIVVFEVIAE
jgi:hypothetical protein